MLPAANVDSGPVLSDILSSLNPAQRQGMFLILFRKFASLTLMIAVQHPPSIPLQILAGPGSGKTKVCIHMNYYSVSDFVP
jgi:DNA helicase-2/ATP-dependent DNA helicase PcrA